MLHVLDRRVTMVADENLNGNVHVSYILEAQNNLVWKWCDLDSHSYYDQIWKLNGIPHGPRVFAQFAGHTCSNFLLVAKNYSAVRVFQIPFSCFETTG